MRRLQLPLEEKMVNVFEPSELWKFNPLGLVPTLVTPENVALTDSSHIVEYLDDLTGAVWPQDFRQRVEMRQVSTLCTGLIQATVSYFQESALHEVPSPNWMRDFGMSIQDTLRTLAKINASMWISSNGELTQAGWDLCVALEYLDLRVSSFQWRNSYPAFEKILEQARLRSDFLETKPKA